MGIWKRVESVMSRDGFEAQNRGEEGAYNHVIVTRV